MGTHSVPVGTVPIRIALADFDRDGDLDILVTSAYYTNQYVSTYSLRRDDDAGQFSPGRDERLHGASSYLAGPILGDGDPDIRYWWGPRHVCGLMAATAHRRPPPLSPSPRSPRCIPIPRMGSSW